MTKSDRAEIANKVIAVIAAHGRRFFHHEGRVSRFEVDARGRVWLHDKYSGARIYTMQRGRWRGFTEGGTLKSLCEALRDYIRTGQPIRRGWFGPWPDYYCDGDLWGYGKEAMETVRREVTALPAVAAPAKTDAPTAAAA